MSAQARSIKSNEDYLREVLARIDGKIGERTLPDTLPEWKHVNTHAQFWAVRHYRKTGAETDPSSPFKRGWGKTADPQAIGLTFTFDPNKSKTATITYLSGDENSLRHFREEYFTERGPAVTQMHIQYREVEPGALRGSYDLEQMESAQEFVFETQGIGQFAICQIRGDARSGWNRQDTKVRKLKASGAAYLPK